MDASEIEAQEFHDRRMARLRVENAKRKAVEKWFAAHDAYHKASDTYNARLAYVRAERERDPAYLSMTCDQEYKALNEAQRAALRADETLYSELLAVEQSPKTESTP